MAGLVYNIFYWLLHPHYHTHRHFYNLSINNNVEDTYITLTFVGRQKEEEENEM